MRVRVLGAGAGGGFPQWNCNCRNCDGVRKGTIRAQARTQSSICVSVDGIDWVLFNASPDVLAQLKSFPALQPARAIRDTGIKAIALMDGQIDHTTGLLMLREGQVPLQIWCTDMVREDMTTGNPLFNVLGHYCTVNWHRLPTGAGSSFTVDGIDGLSFTAVPLKSKAPPTLRIATIRTKATTSGCASPISAPARTCSTRPGLGEIEPHLQPSSRPADAVMVDGTFWTDDEMIQLGISKKHARDIGHLPQSGPGGMIEVLQPLKAQRKVLIHINNTNPILDEDSSERAHLTRAGIEVAFDGMEINL
jgi:pyrroloquinoline quinone biosynthesis protein B